MIRAMTGFVACLVLAGSPALGAMMFTGTPLLENFDSLPTSSSATFFPASVGTPTLVPGSSGWVGTRMSGTGTTMAYTAWLSTTATGTGAVVGAATSSGDTERALGTLTSAAHRPGIGVEIVNNASGPLVEVTISFMQENWRVPGSGGGSEVGVVNVVPAEYGSTGSGITAATIFTATTGFTNEALLNLVSAVPVVDNAPNPGDHAAAAASDGNLTGNRVLRSATIDLSSSPIGVGESLFLRFIDVDDLGADGISAIDDFNFSAIVVPEPSVIVLASLGLLLVGAPRRGYRR